MSDSALKIRFDGPILADHAMDVTDLAPSLLAVADLCKNANKLANGDRAAVKVLVNADVEQNCFELYLELAMTVFEQVRQLVAHEGTKDAKEILEWLGLISGGAGAATWGLIRLVQKISNKPIEKVEFVNQEGRDQVVLTITGDNNQVEVIRTSKGAFDLAKNAVNLNAVKKLVEPLSKEGYESLVFDRGDSEKESITRQDAAEILKINSDDVADALDDKEEPQVVTAWIKVYSPVYETEVKNWRFQYGEQKVYMDVSETDIAERAINRGGALVDDSYKVKLEIVQSKTSTKMSYKILEVLEFHPASLQSQSDFVVRGQDSD